MRYSAIVMSGTAASSQEPGRESMLGHAPLLLARKPGHDSSCPALRGLVDKTSVHACHLQSSDITRSSTHGIGPNVSAKAGTVRNGVSWSPRPCKTSSHERFVALQRLFSPMPLGDLVSLTGLLLQDRGSLVLRIDDGGTWRVEAVKSARAMLGRRVLVIGTRDAFYLCSQKHHSARALTASARDRFGSLSKLHQRSARLEKCAARGR